MSTSGYYLDEDFVPRAGKPRIQNLCRTAVLDMQVSTTFLGIDHRHFYDTGFELPLLFETMVFGGWWDQSLQWRETSFARAMARHRMTIRLMTRAMQVLGELHPEQETLVRLGGSDMLPTPTELVEMGRHASG